MRRDRPCLQRPRRLVLLVAILIIGFAAAARGDEPTPVATRYGLGLEAGHVYDPGDDIDFVLASAFALYDYDRIWPHRAPEALRFRVEVAAGSTTGSHHSFLAAANMFAVYLFDRPRRSWQPYAEAGIGLFYTGFRVDGQGLRLNFNPQAGVGLEWRRSGGTPLYFNVRLHHVSNGDLHEDNRGLNSVLISAGAFF